MFKKRRSTPDTRLMVEEGTLSQTTNCGHWNQVHSRSHTRANKDDLGCFSLPDAIEIH